MIRKMLGRLLERQGVQAAGMAFAEDGALAVQAVAQQAHIDHYNIVFLDNNMPNMVSAVLINSYVACLCRAVAVLCGCCGHAFMYFVATGTSLSTYIYKH